MHKRVIWIWDQTGQTPGEVGAGEYRRKTCPTRRNKRRQHCRLDLRNKQESPGREGTGGPLNVKGESARDRHPAEVKCVWERQGCVGVCAQQTECPCPSKIHMLNPYPSHDGIRRRGVWRWWGHESRATMNGISVHRKRGSREISHPVQQCGGHSENMPSMNQEVVLTKHQICWYLDSPVSRTVRNKRGLFISRWVSC